VSSPEPQDSTWTLQGFNLSSIRSREPPVSPTKSASKVEETQNLSNGPEGRKGAAQSDAILPPSRISATLDVLSTNKGQSTSRVMDIDTLSRLPATQVREMREAFQLLDRDNDGRIGREDIVEMLGSLGLDTSASAIAPFFNHSSPTVTLPTYLSTLSSLFGCLSQPSELLAALDAFDDNDSGQIDIAELKDALLHTTPENGERGPSEREIDKAMEGWVGPRAFGKGGFGGAKGVEGVFRYRDWVAGLGIMGETGKQADQAR